MKFASGRSLAVLAVALLIGKILSVSRGRRPRLWHEGPQWERLLRVYDEIAAESFLRGCDSRLLPPTRFGSTQVHACGDPSHPPLLLFHGVSANSLMFGDWLVPALSDRYYAVAVDTLCDMGRSLPRDGDPFNCPQSQEEMGEWAKDVLDQLGIKRPASLVGYSFGSFVAACVAQTYPELVDKLVLIAPAAVFAPIEKGWIMRAILFGVSYHMAPTVRMQRQLRTWFFSYMMPDPSALDNMKRLDLREAIDAVGSAGKVGADPVAFDVGTLKKIASRNPTMLIIGEEETVINATLAIDTAMRAGVFVKQYPKSGHMLLIEYPKELVEGVIFEFLEKSGAE